MLEFREISFSDNHSLEFVQKISPKRSHFNSEPFSSLEKIFPTYLSGIVNLLY